MPSIEIVCIDEPHPSDFSSLPLAVIADSHLQSHRSPSPLFQSDFDNLRGCMYHLGDPKLRDSQGFFFAWQILSEACRNQDSKEFLEFGKEFWPDVKAMLECLVNHSPMQKVIFTSDYQFGPEMSRYLEALSLQQFEQLHCTTLLRFNCLYTVSFTSEE